MSPGPSALDLLDDQAALEAADPADMLRVLASAAAQVREAVVLSAEAGVARFGDEDRPRTVVVLGMGGSGIAGDILAAVAGPACPVPILSHRGFGLPTWVGAADLVVAVSCSGRTEETQSGLEEAVRRGCRLLVVAHETSPIADLGRRGRGIVVPVPQGRVPRAALWALSVPLLVAADALALLSAPPGVLEGAALALEAVAQRCAPGHDLVVNPAKTLALELLGAVPVLWGTTPVTGVAAHRGACQLNENAEVPAVWGVLPEVGHNQVALLDGPFARRAEGDLFADPYDDHGPAPAGSRARLVLLRDEIELPAVARRAQVVQELAEERGVGVSALLGSGATGLERLALLVGTLDFASIYLALLQGTDPTPNPAIDVLKARTQR